MQRKPSLQSRVMKSVVAVLSLSLVALASAFVSYHFIFKEPKRNVAFYKSAKMSSTHTGTAGIAVDGRVDDGKFFSTLLEDAPNWTVDLESEIFISGLEIHNRSDCCQERALSLMVLTSLDGVTWQTVYRHDKKPFGGGNGSMPALQITFPKVLARFVRVQLAERNYLHLSEIRVLAD